MCLTTVNNADEWSIHKFVDVSLRSLDDNYNKSIGLRYCHVTVAWYTWTHGMLRTDGVGHVWTKSQDCCGLFQQTMSVQTILILLCPLYEYFQIFAWAFHNRICNNSYVLKLNELLILSSVWSNEITRIWRGMISAVQCVFCVILNLASSLNNTVVGRTGTSHITYWMV